MSIFSRTCRVPWRNVQVILTMGNLAFQAELGSKAGKR